MKTTRVCVVLAVSLGLMLALGWLLAGARLLTARAAGSVIYVDGDAAAGGDGQSWVTAYRTVEEALSGAGAGDEIWVAEGVYTPTNVAGREATFQLKDGVGLYGGFVGTETLRAERDWEAHVTVLSGDLDGDDITDVDGVVTATIHMVGENAYHVVTGSGVTETARLDGFTVTSGKANGSDPHYGGGGMFNDGGSPTLANVTFSGNRAYWYGGGMYNYDSSPALTNVTFSGNTAVYYGGGMFNLRFSSPALMNVTFSGNAAYCGGGMHSFGLNSGPTLANVTFSGNIANDSGGGMFSLSSNPTLASVTFSGNAAGERGGGMFNSDSRSTLANVTFSGNTAGERGGGMSNVSSSPILTDVTFSGNTAVYYGGGMYNDGSSPALTDVTFSGNHVDLSGGGMCNWDDSSATLTNVTFSGNSADWDGGGMYNLLSNPALANCILWGNSAGARAQIYNDGSTPVISYTLLQGSGGSGAGWDSTLGTDGGGNVDADPQFVRDPSDGGDGWGVGENDDYGNLRLRSASPAIDTGDNAVVPAGVTTDLDGRLRFFDVPFVADGGSGTPPVVDMGAYEAQWMQRCLFPLALK